MTPKREQGFTFFEVMVAVVILSIGVTAIYRSFFSSLNVMNHVVCRLYANNLLTNKLIELQQEFSESGEIFFEKMQGIEEVVISNKKVRYSFSTGFKNVEDLGELLEVAISLSWKEGNRDISLTRSAYISRY